MKPKVSYIERYFCCSNSLYWKYLYSRRRLPKFLMIVCKFSGKGEMIPERLHWHSFLAEPVHTFFISSTNSNFYGLWKAMHQHFSWMKPTMVFPSLFNVFFLCPLPRTIFPSGSSIFARIADISSFVSCCNGESFFSKDSAIAQRFNPPYWIGYSSLSFETFWIWIKKRFFKELKLQRNIF